MRRLTALCALAWVAGCQGAAGEPGSPGAAGEGGASCTAVDDGDTVTITCEDGTTVTLSDGTNGTNGTHGTNGSSGTNGTNGADGATALIRLEDDDGHCPHGGTAVHTGINTNGDEDLDDDEITDTAYVCNAPGGEPLCTTIDGNVRIENALDFFTFAALGCSGVTGMLTTTDVQGLESLDGLERLTSVGYLDLSYNEFSDISGLSNLTSLGGVFIDTNPFLGDLSPLGGVASMPAGVIIQNTPIHTLGLTSLNEAGGLFIRGDDNLTSLSGLEQLTTVDGALVLEGDFADLEGLANLTSIAGNLKITSPSLESISPITGLIGYTSLWFDTPMLDSLAPLADFPVALEEVVVLSDAMTALEIGFWVVNIEKSLWVEGDSLATVDAGSLETVEDILIRGALTSFEVGSLETVTGWLHLEDTLLTSLPGLNSADTITNLSLVGNHSLTGLDVVEELDATAVERIVLVDNTSLVNLGKLSEITSLLSAILADVPLTELAALESVGSLTIGKGIPSLAPLTALATVGSLEVNDSDLTNLDGLTAVTELEYLYILCNDSLTTLGGLGALDTVGEVWIAGNPGLSQATIDAFLTGVSVDTLVEDPIVCP